MIFDADGDTFINDVASGIGMLAVGHSPAPVVRAIQEQAAKYIHPCALVTTYEPYVRLCGAAERARSRRRSAKKTILANSGAEAVENAVKLVAQVHRARRRSFASKAAITGARF